MGHERAAVGTQEEVVDHAAEDPFPQSRVPVSTGHYEAGPAVLREGPDLRGIVSVDVTARPSASTP